jgi:hypothetical protein
MTEAGTNKPSDGNVSHEPPRPSFAPSEGRGGTPKTFRSGYARQKNRLLRVLAENDDLRLEAARLREELSDLETMFDELKRLNAELAADLRQTRQHRVANLTSTLFGQSYGR